jgi:hypothetical protein
MTWWDTTARWPARGWVEALRAVAEHLLAHLDDEVQAMTPTLQQWDRCPGH